MKPNRIIFLIYLGVYPRNRFVDDLRGHFSWSSRIQIQKIVFIETLQRGGVKLTNHDVAIFQMHETHTVSEAMLQLRSLKFCKHTTEVWGGLHLLQVT